MTIDPSIRGVEYGAINRGYDERDVILYALAVGADRLEHVYEPVVRVLPTFPVILPFEALMQMEELLKVDPAAVLHGEQRLRLHGPIPARGRAEVATRVSNVWDKGAGAVIESTAEISVDGRLVATAGYASFVRGGGGFGGERGEGLVPPAVDRPPDSTATQTTLDHQALLYRLCGDTNPLHADPAFARSAGFHRPILHGLCTYGFAVRIGMHLTNAGIVGADARFTGVVFPGETLSVDLWHMAPDLAYVRVRVPEREAVVIDPLLLALAPA